MSVFLALQAAYPGLIDAECQVTDDGDGPYISKWERAEPEPDAAAITAALNAWAEQARLAKWQEKKAWAKEEASSRILALAPIWKQMNMIARGLELERKDRRGGVNAAEQTEIDAIDAVWTQVKAIRTRSDEIEAAIDAIDPVSPTADADLEAIVW